MVALEIGGRLHQLHHLLLDQAREASEPGVLPPIEGPLQLCIGGDHVDPLLAPGDGRVHVHPVLVPARPHHVHDRLALGTLGRMEGDV